MNSQYKLIASLADRRTVELRATIGAPPPPAPPSTPPSPVAPPQGGTLIAIPRVNGIEVDWCASFATQCGQPAADQFCRVSGLGQALGWRWVYTDRTIFPSDGRLCEVQGKCGALRDVRCSVTGPVPAGDPQGSSNASSPSFIWAGMGGDLAGKGVPGGPDGVPDGNFNLRYLPNYGTLASVWLYETRADGTKTSAVWSTSASCQCWLIRVSWRGQPVIGVAYTENLNIIPESLSLHVPDNGALADGHHFLVELRYADGRVHSMTTKIGAAPAPPPTAGPATGTVAGAQFSWAGMGTDLTGPYGQTSGDGKQDGTFRLVIPAGAAPVRRLLLTGLSREGAPTEANWASDLRGYWLLRASMNGAEVTPRAYSDNINLGPGAYLLHMTPAAALVNGDSFRVVVDFTDGRSLELRTTVGATAPGSVNTGPGVVPGIPGVTSGVPGATANVCADPRTLGLMDQWLRSANPPQREGDSLRYEPWGRLVGQTATAFVNVSGPPDTRLSRCEWLWTYARSMGSTNAGTLYDFLVSRLR